jgi:hypothetical protein
MNFDLSDEPRAFQDSVRGFAERYLTEGVFGRSFSRRPART